MRPMTDEELTEMKEWLQYESTSLFGIPITASLPVRWLAQCVKEIERLKKDIKSREVVLDYLEEALKSELKQSKKLQAHLDLIALKAL